MSNDLIIALSALSVAVAIGIALLLTWLAGAALTEVSLPNATSADLSGCNPNLKIITRSSTTVRDQEAKHHEQHND